MLFSIASTTLAPPTFAQLKRATEAATESGDRATSLAARISDLTEELATAKLAMTAAIDERSDLEVRSARLREVWGAGLVCVCVWL